MYLYYTPEEIFRKDLNRTKAEALKKKEEDINGAKNEIIERYIQSHGERLDYKKRQELRGLLQEPERKAKGEVKKEILIANEVEGLDRVKLSKLGKKRHSIVVYGEKDLNDRVRDFFFFSSNKRADTLPDARTEYMENNIKMLNENLRSLTKTYGSQLNAIPEKGAILHKRSVGRLQIAYKNYLEFCNSTDNIEAIFWAGQKYLYLAYNGGLDIISSYTAYLLLVYTNLSLSEVEGLTGISSSTLSRVRSKKRWEELHFQWFLTDREKAEAIKEFKVIAENKATVYDLELKSPVKNRSSRKK